VASPNGEPVLRLYAWERVKRFAYSIDLHLPSGSRFLFAHIRLINPHPHEIPMYWWTNIGVPEYPGGRVICPAETAFKAQVPQDCPLIDGVDHSYVTRVRGAYDLFFRIPEGRRPWIAQVDPQGRGIVHTSTQRLRGRKLFAWGMGRGSRRWNEYLSEPGLAFQEIQGGLARTQQHSVPMPAKSEWFWTEAFGSIELDPTEAHDTDWRTAYQKTERVLDGLLPLEELDRFHTAAVQTASRIPEKVLFHGLAWGALESLKAEAQGENNIPESMPFSKDEIGAAQEPWWTLLTEGRFPESDLNAEPGEYMIDPAWQTLLERSLQTEAGKKNWLAWYHLGVMKLEAGDEAGAKEAWVKSNELTPNGWSLRNLAFQAHRQEDWANALKWMEKAWAVGPKHVALAVEYGHGLIKVGQWETLGRILSEMPETVRTHERVRLLSAQLALRSNQFDEVEKILNSDFDTIREGEIALSDLWYELQARKLAQREHLEYTPEFLARVKQELDPPVQIDFRMSEKTGEAYVAPQAEDGDKKC
jgi:hypothetical protein